MHQSVLDIFPKFTCEFEGRVSWMYLDIKGLVTIGLGCLIDPEVTAGHLPFVRLQDKQPANASEICLEWNRIKGMKTLAQKGHLAARQYCALRLLERDIDNLARKRLLDNELILKLAFPDWNNFPADAQLAINSMAWAMGAFFFRKWPRFMKAVNDKDWNLAAVNCSMRTEGNPGLIPRNKANKKLFLSAATLSPYPLSVLRGYS
jgi:GH24 family phage-related lysozyme (muramidase)